jgi:Flp pilus assembly pilin Flp
MLLSIRRLVRPRWAQRGQAMPEYAVIGAAIIVAAYVIFQSVGTGVNSAMTSVLPAF